MINLSKIMELQPIRLSSLSGYPTHVISSNWTLVDGNRACLAFFSCIFSMMRRLSLVSETILQIIIGSWSVLQIRGGKRDNLGITLDITLSKLML